MSVDTIAGYKPQALCPGVAQLKSIIFKSNGQVALIEWLLINVVRIELGNKSSST